MVLAWRNHPEVRRHMLTTQEISGAEHRAWFDRSCRDPLKRLLLVEAGGAPFGYVAFSGVRAGEAADWGFYVAPGEPKGSGRRLGRAALDFAFSELALHKVCGQALVSNEASIRLHLALGFTREGILREQHRSGSGHQDLACFGLLQREWPVARQAMEQTA